MLFAVEEINNDPKLLPNISLGVEIYDTCRSQTIGADNAKKFVRYRLTNQTAPLAAVIGSFRSDVTMAVANILRVFDIAQVSYGSSSPSLSNKDIYSYLFRTVPPASFQAKAMVDLVKAMGWSYVSTVYSPGQYAEKGMEIVYKEAKKVNLCVASKIKLPEFPTEDDYRAAIRQLVEVRNSTDKGKLDVVVLYCIQRDNEGLLRAAKQLLPEKTFTWVASNSWGNRDVARGAEEVATGALTVYYLSGKVQRFNDYLLSRNPKNNRYGKWFEEFWQDVVNCDLSDGPLQSAFPRKCTDNDTIPENFNIAPVRLVINAVYAVAHALHDMRKDLCPAGSGLCPSMRRMKGHDVLRYLKNVTFPDASFNVPLRFNRNQEVDGNYTVLNFRKTGEHYGVVQVGTWDGHLTKYGSMTGSLAINKSGIVWGGVGMPASFCSRECSSQQVRHHDRAHPWCCWRCEDCDKRSVVTNNTCRRCQDGYRPVGGQCERLPVVHASWSHPAAIAFTLFAFLGLLATLMTAVFFAVHKEHQVIKAAAKELCAILIAGVFSCHVGALLYFGKPEPALCAARRFMSTVSMTMCYAPVLLRTNRIYRIFRSAQSSAARPSFVSPKSQIAAACGMIAVQICLTLLWVLSKPPSDVHDYEHEQRTVLGCNSDFKTLAASLSYNAALMLVSTAHAFKTRNFPRNFNEAKFIAISMYVSCSVWVVFIPCYVNAADAVQKDLFLSAALLLIGATTLAGLLAPKVYLVMTGTGADRKQSTFNSLDKPNRIHGVGFNIENEGSTSVTTRKVEQHEMKWLYNAITLLIGYRKGRLGSTTLFWSDAIL